MSHFVVLVIGKDPEKQLAPYDENLRVAPYKQYYEGRYATPEAIRARLREPDCLVTVDEDILADDVALMADWHGEKPEEIGRDEQGWWYLSTYNPKSKWDWHSLGGRWRGQVLRITPEAAARGDYQIGESGGLGNTRPRDSLWVDACLAGDVDWDGMRADAERDARARWRERHAVLDQHPPMRTLDAIQEELGLDLSRTREDSTAEEIARALALGDQARETYNAQPGLTALRLAHTDASKGWSYVHDIDEYLCGEDWYAQQARDAVGVPFAIVKDGEWYERGRMGWWGIVTGETTQHEWNARVAELLAGLPPDTLLSCGTATSNKRGEAMGIDIYLSWDGMTKEDEEARYTGFSVVAGNLGYLREAYHGGPYATRHLVSEAFDDQGEDERGPAIPAATLRERLPRTLELAKERARVVYNEEVGDDDPVLQSFVSFVELAERKEQETGKPVHVYASW